MQNNEFQRLLSGSQFQLTCGRENCIRNVNSTMRLVDLGRKNDDKSPWWNPSISACFHSVKELFLQTSVCRSPPNYSATIIYYFPDRCWPNESLESKSKWSPHSWIYRSSVCVCNIHVNWREAGKPALVTLVASIIACHFHFVAMPHGSVSPPKFVF